MKRALCCALGVAIVASIGGCRVDAHVRPSSASGQYCRADLTACRQDDQCCSTWCVNGYCERREP
jgi:hypothetical protein